MKYKIDTTYSCKKKCFVKIDEIKPCPFCGSEAYIFSYDAGAPYPGCYLSIDCGNEHEGSCFNEIPMMKKTTCKDRQKSVDVLLKRWNKRKI